MTFQGPFCCPSSCEWPTRASSWIPFSRIAVVRLYKGVKYICLQFLFSQEQKYSHLFSVLDQCLMTIFVCEILVKWYHSFFMFWKMGWNVLDFFIVVALLLGPCEFRTDWLFWKKWDHWNTTVDSQGNRVSRRFELSRGRVIRGQLKFKLFTYYALILALRHFNVQMLLCSVPDNFHGLEAGHGRDLRGRTQQLNLCWVRELAFTGFWPKNPLLSRTPLHNIYHNI